MSSANDSQACSSSQSQEESAGNGEDERIPISNYPIIPREELVLGEQLGAGAYGSVYRGIWKIANKEVSVAIKKVFMLEKEADILSKVRHRNIIEFFGVSQTNPDFFIVTEFAENGSLYDFVHKANSNEIEFDQILNWAIQIAQGVSYLHYEAPDTIIHRDLKSKNVVLSADLVCKLCDFGTSKNLTHSWTAPSWGGTAAWMSPEIISQQEGITTATDVWSYAVVLWEMISREIPYKGLTEFSIYSMIAQQGVTLVIPEECPSALADLMKNCWRTNPKDRYDMKQVVSALEAMLGNSELTEQCGAFLKHKDDWKIAIQRQLVQLEEQKIDYAKKMEELTKWERALKRREENQREIMETDSHALEGDVALWDEGQVCQWIKKVSPKLSLQGELLDRLIALVMHHNISGRRLLDITPKDLEYLGICSLGLRINLFREIRVLRKENHRMKNFPTLAVSQQQLDQQKRSERSAQPLTLSLVIHVTMYTRQSGFDFLPKFRYKILVDTDWEDAYLTDDLPEDLRNAHSIVKDVCISVIYDDTNSVYEPFRCTRGPFTVADWIDSPMSGGEVGVVCAISYTDRVIRPRNTCMRTKIFDFSRPQTLEVKKIDVVVRAYPSSAVSPSKNPLPISERHQYKTSTSGDSGISVSGTLQGVWRNRASSTGLGSTEISDSLPAGAPKIGNQTKSPLWADIAAGLRGASSPSPISTPGILMDSSKSIYLNSKTVVSPVDTVKEEPQPPPVETPSRKSINHYFSPESLSRDSIIVPRPTTSVFREPFDHHVGKSFRFHHRQQVANRKPNTNRIRRRPLPIILPTRRKMSSISFHQDDSNFITPEISITEAFDDIVHIDRSPAISYDNGMSSVIEHVGCGRGLTDLQPCQESSEKLSSECSPGVKESEADNSAAGTESGKKRRRRRHRPHKRSNTVTQEQSFEQEPPVPEALPFGDANSLFRDHGAKQIHGGYNKWSWKVYGNEPE